MNPPSLEKQAWKPGNVLSPVPAVLVSCGGVGAWKRAKRVKMLNSPGLNFLSALSVLSAFMEAPRPERARLLAVAFRDLLRLDVELVASAANGRP